MYRRLSILVCLTLFCVLGNTQNNTTVTGTIVDSDGITWANGTWSAQLNSPTGKKPVFLDGSGPVTPQYGPFSLGVGGTLSQAIPNNAAIGPAGTNWTFTFCPYSTAPCTQLSPITITGATFNISAYAAANIKPPRFAAVTSLNNYGYSDVEITPTPAPGGSYFNTVSLCTRQWNGGSWACIGTGGGSIPFPPNFSVQISNVGQTALLSDPNIFENTSTHTLTSTIFNSSTRQYQNTPDKIDVVADCGLVGDNITLNDSAFAVCIAAHPFVPFFFPALFGSVQAKYKFASPFTIPTQNSLYSTGYNHKGINQGAIIQTTVSGQDGILINSDVQLHDINVFGVEPASTSTIDPQNIIFPSGFNLFMYQQAILTVNVTSGVMTISFFPAQSALWRVGGAVQVAGLTGGLSGLNGYFYIQTVNGAYGGTGLLNFPYTQIQVNVPGAANVATTTVSGTCPSGACVLPATTGPSTSVGIKVAGTFTNIRNVTVQNFGFAGISNDGQDFISDNTTIQNVISQNNRGFGYISYGGDSNVGHSIKPSYYFNGLYGDMELSFLSAEYDSPQATCNGNCQNTVAGVPVNISTISRSCNNFVCTNTVTTSAPHGLAVGNGIVTQGVTDTSYNIPTHFTNTIGGFVSTVPSSTQFTYIQPIDTVALTTGSSSGGTVALGSAFQVYVGSGLDTGAYATGHNFSVAHNYLYNMIYNEGGQGLFDPFKCANRFDVGTILMQTKLGDCVDQLALPSTSTAYGALNWQFSPFTVAVGAQMPQQSPQFTPPVNIQVGINKDTNAVLGPTDILCSVFGTFPSCALTHRFTAPGQNTSWYGYRATDGSDQTGLYNYSALFGYGGTKESGESSTIGAATFTGTGLNDATSGGTSTSTTQVTYTVSICATGTPDSWTFASGTQGPISTLTLGNSGGSGYHVGDWVNVNISGAGTLAATIQVDSISSGAITAFHIVPGYPGVNFSIGLNNATTILYGTISTFAIGAAGTNYHVGDTGLLLAGNNAIQATYTVTTVNGSNGVTGLTINAVAGEQYGIFTGKGTVTGGSQPGTGSGLTVNITGISGSGATVNIIALTINSPCATMPAGGTPVTLASGATIQWAANTGHTLVDKWSVPNTVVLGDRPQFWAPNALRLGNTIWNAGPRKQVECAIPNATTVPPSCSPDGNFSLGDIAWNDGSVITTPAFLQCTASHVSGSVTICDTWVGPGSGGGGTLTGSGTLNTIPLWTGTTALGNSSLTQANNFVINSATNGFSAPYLSVGASGTQAMQMSTGYTNDGTTGTAALHFAKIVGNTAVETGTGDVGVRLFVIDTAANWPASSGGNLCTNGTTGQACLLLAIPGTQNTVTFDAGGATINHFVCQSTTVIGAATDCGTSVAAGVACFGQATAAVAASSTGVVAVGVCPIGH